MLTNKKLSRVISQLLAAAIMVTLIPGCSRTGPETLLAGKRLEDQGKYAAAAADLREAVQLMPTNALAWNYLGVAYHHSGEPVKALQAYQQSLKLNREVPVVHYNLGCLLLENSWEGAAEGAKNELIFFTARQGNHRDGWVKLGTAQMRLGELVAADKSFAEALRGGQTAEILNDLGLVEEKRNHHREAAGYFLMALKLEPTYGPAILNLAVVSETHLNNRPFALRKYEDYLALKPRPANWSAVEALAVQLDHELNPPPPPQPPARPVIHPTNPPPQVVSVPPPVTNSPPKTSASLTNNPVRPAVINPTPPPRTIAAVTNVPIRAATPTTGNPLRTALVVTNNPARIAAASPPKPEPPPYKPPAKAPFKPEPTEVVRLAPAPVFKVAANPAPPVTAPQVKSEPILHPPPAPVAFTNLTVATNSPPVQVTSEPPKTVETAVTTNAPPEAGPAGSEKRGIISKLNPLNLFHHQSRAGESTTPLLDQTNDIANTNIPPTVSPALPTLRYTYLSPSKPANGNRLEAERAFAQGVEAQRTHRLNSAELSYQEAVRADPGFFEAQLNLGLAAFEYGDMPQSLTAYETALAIKPDSFNARFNFALALKKAGYIQDAAQELERLLVSPPADQPVAHISMAHLTLANLYAQQFHQAAPARTHYLKVLELDPRNPQATAIQYWLRDNP